MLKAWLPLLCRTTTSSLVCVPIPTFGKNADILKILEEMIEKLTREEQKDVLYLWLLHYPVNADSHWFNLEKCFYALVLWSSRALSETIILLYFNRISTHCLYLLRHVTSNLTALETYFTVIRKNAFHAAFFFYLIKEYLKLKIVFLIDRLD